MDMKVKAKIIKDIFNVSCYEDLPAAVKSVVLSGSANIVYDRYTKDVGIDADYMQKTYQFFIADRGKGTKQQDYTPASIAKLTALLAQCPSNGVIYDLCSGSGALTIAAHEIDSSLSFVCEELDENVIPILLFNLAIRNINAIVLRGDVLTDTIYDAYKVSAGDKYSVVSRISEYKLGKYDGCISNPPYNIQWNPVQDGLFMPEKYSLYGTPPSSNANFAFVLHGLHHLKDGCKASFILPNGVLSSSIERDIRRNLVIREKINSVVTLPGNMFESTNIATCILTLGCNSEKITMVNAKETCHEEIRNQSGEGDISHTSRIYHKKFNVLTSEDVKKIVRAASSDNIDSVGFCKRTSRDEVEEHDYILTPARYVGIKAAPTNHRPYSDIISDIRELSREKNAVKITMNQTLAKEMGWDSIAELVKDSAELTKKMNGGIIKLLGGEPIEEECWITLSKRAGEIKLENMSKETVSSIFAIFMPMLKQHIFYLNNRQNELLAELRDAVLPELMNGNIDVSKIEN